ncbi:MAG: hypothetical protein WBX00_36555 [Isosphaeraceae bacterium]
MASQAPYLSRTKVRGHFYFYGRPIDGNDDGVPGGNYVAIVTKHGVTTSAVAAPETIKAKAVDVLLDRGELEGLSRNRHRPARLH